MNADLNKKNNTSLSNINSLNTLKKGDYIAFGFNYNGGEPNEIIVDNITSIEKSGRVLVHFLYGHRSLAKHISKSDIIAIGNHKANGKIKGWSGNYEILKPDHPLLENCDI